jgi:hypothetical protein
MQKRKTTKVLVREMFDNGDERCEVRWPPGSDGVDSPVDDWRQVRDVDLCIDPVTSEAVFSFTRNSIGRARRRVET